MTNVMHMTTADAAQPPDLACLLRAAGMSEPDIQVWLLAEQVGTLHHHAGAILGWTTAFEDQGLARTWYDSRAVLEDALPWIEAGFTVAQYERLVDYSLDRLHTIREEENVDRVLGEQAAWLNSGLPPAWILFFVDCGVHDAEEGQNLFSRAQTDPVEVVRLGVLRALMGGK